MNIRNLGLAALLTLSTATGVAAQTVYSPVGQSAVGDWIYNAQGEKIGSVRALTDGGRTADIMIGSYFRPGSHVASVPVSALSMVNGHVTMRTETVDALNVRSAQ